LSLLPVEKWEFYKNELVVEVLKLNGTLESNESPSVANTTKNPFSHLMNGTAVITPHQMDQRLKLRAVSGNRYVISKLRCLGIGQLLESTADRSY
jgi:hypothetical protein